MRIIELIKPFSFRTRIVVYFTGLIAAIFLVSDTILYLFISPFAQNLVSQYTVEAIKQTNSKLDGMLEQVEVLSNNILANTNVMEYMDDYGTNETKYYNIPYIRKDFLSLCMPRNDIFSIYLIKDSQVALKYDTGLLPVDDEDQERLIKYKNDTVREVNDELTFIGPIAASRKSDELTFAAVRKIYDLFFMKPSGEILIQIKYNMVSDILDNVDVGNKGSLYLVDSSGKIMYGSDRKMINTQLDPVYWNQISTSKEMNYTKTYDGKLLVSNKSEYTGWYILEIIPLNKVFAPIIRMENIFFIIVLTSLILTVILALLLSRSISNPITQLVRKMKKVKGGNLHVEIKEESYDEIKELNNTFNEMMQSLNRMIQEVYEARLGQKEAELKALQAQINPHFLYNTLDVINWMAIVRDQPEIGQKVRALSNLLRYNISGGDKPVEVKEEIKQLQGYMDIQKARFGDSFNYCIEMDSAAENLMIKKFLLQPIVENSIVHGIKGMENGEIHIRAFLKEGILTMEVIDNGIGLSQETIDELLSDEYTSDKESTGIGVSNVNRRIKLFYGEKYGMRITSTPPSGTTVQLILPAENKT